MTFAEVAAELTYHRHLSLDQIARLDDDQLLWIYFRQRDEWGCLLRDGKREWRPGDPIVEFAVSFESMVKQVWRERGYSKEEIQALWLDYLDENPKYLAVPGSESYAGVSGG